MPKGGISLYFTIQDRASSVLTGIGDKTKALDKETQSLAQSAAALTAANKPLIQQQNELKMQLEKSSQAVKDARKEWQQYGDEVHEQKLKDAIQEQDDLRRSLKDTEDQLKANQKTYQEYREAIRKGTLEDEGLGRGISGGAVGDLSDELGALGAGFATSGIGNLLADSIGGYLGAQMTSALGTEASAALSSTISGALSGAAMGSIAGPIGAAIGAAVGGIGGAITGEAQIFETKDDSFKEYYQGQQETVLGAQSSRVESGSTLAGSREQTQLAFAKRYGSDEAAADYLSKIQEFAADTNYSFDEIVGYSKSLLNTYNPDEVFGVLTRLSDATAGLNLSSSDVDTLISGLSRMRTTGKATSEYLNFFSERGIDTYQALANATGADKSDIAEMIKDGEIGGAEAAEAILTYINDTFGGLSDQLTSTYDAMVDNLSDAEAMLDARAGEGYNEERKKGIAAQSEWLEEQGDEMGDAYSMIGQWKASLENLAEQYEREALNSVLEGGVDEDSLFAGSDQKARLEELAQEYQDVLADYNAGNEEAGATMGRILAEAQAIAMNEYNASEGYQLELENQLELAGRLRDDAALNEAYYDAGYKQGEEFSKGMTAAIEKERIEALSGWGWADYRNWYGAENGGNLGAHKEAVGISYVPEDNWPALLHEGERVLTAREARAYNAGQGGGAGINITVNSLSVREEADVDKIAARLLEEIELAQMTG